MRIGELPEPFPLELPARRTWESGRSSDHLLAATENGMSLAVRFRFPSGEMVFGHRLELHSSLWSLPCPGDAPLAVPSEPGELKDCSLSRRKHHPEARWFRPFFSLDCIN